MSGPKVRRDETGFAVAAQARILSIEIACDDSGLSFNYEQKNQNSSNPGLDGDSRILSSARRSEFRSNE
jgi:hypothetical protein